MKLHAHCYDPNRKAWALQGIGANEEDAFHLLPLDRPTILVLPGRLMLDRGGHQRAMSRVAAMVGSGNPYKELSGMLGKTFENTFITPVNPADKKINCTMFSYAKGEDMTEHAVASYYNDYPPSLEAGALADTLWKSVCTAAGTQTPSAEEAVQVLSRLTILTYSFGSLFAQPLNEALAMELLTQINPSGEQRFSRKEVQAILAAIVEVNVGSFPCLANSKENTFTRYSFCGLNDLFVYEILADASQKLFQPLMKVATEAGYPYASSAEMRAIRDKTLPLLAGRLTVLSYPAATVISDIVPGDYENVHNNPHFPHMQAARGPQQLGYADLFGRLILHALMRKGPIQDPFVPLLTSPPRFFSGMEDIASPVSAMDHLVTQRARDAIARGKGIPSIGV